MTIQKLLVVSLAAVGFSVRPGYAGPCMNDGTVKAWPGAADVVASQARRPALTPLRQCPAQRAGRDEGTAWSAA